MSVDKYNLQEWIGIIMIPALFYSTAITSICLAAFFVISISGFSKINNWKNPLFAWCLIWALVFISGWNNQNTELWQTNLFLKLPFLFMPLAIIGLPKFSIRYIYDLHIWLLLVLLFTAIPILNNYLIHHQEILSKMGQGHPIPMPIHHVLYSMIMAYGIIANLYILLKGKHLLGNFKKGVIFLIVVCLIIQHIFAVRTGLVVLYLSIPVAIAMTLKEKKTVYISIVTIIAIGAISIRTIPSLKHKLAYMKYDLEQYRSGKGMSYADSERILSLKSGIQVWKSAPLLGVGYGDLLDKMKTFGINKYPHSQFIYTLSGAGVLGLLLLIVGLLFPYYFYSGPLKGLVTLLYLNLFICMTIDFVLEHSVIVAFLNLFGLIIFRLEE